MPTVSGAGANAPQSAGDSRIQVVPRTVVRPEPFGSGRFFMREGDCHELFIRYAPGLFHGGSDESEPGLYENGEDSPMTHPFAAGTGDPHRGVDPDADRAGDLGKRPGGTYSGCCADGCAGDCVGPAVSLLLPHRCLDIWKAVCQRDRRCPNYFG